MSDKTNPFSNQPNTISRLADLKDGKQVIVVTQAFGPDGEDLMDDSDHRFSGERGIKLLVRQGDVEATVCLSPFFGDPSKVTNGDFVEGERCELLCPTTREPLEEIIALRGHEGEARYYSIYLTPKLQGSELVAVNDIWGNPHSRILSEGEMLALIAEMEIAQQES